MQDIRWKQRFNNFQSALAALGEFVDLGELNKYEEQGMVKAFEYTYELAWKTLKDFLEYQGVAGVVGSRDAFRTAFSNEIVQDGHLWMSMIESRNKTAHTYNKKTAEEIALDVRERFYPAFRELESYLQERL
ncbi:MAG: nucleotidyltransferase substrate binding protein [Kiritimatiellae bacterium]|nr:nucleotidyltransferase substrate binding protein [Kiritimatiellia bacterium]